MMTSLGKSDPGSMSVLPIVEHPVGMEATQNEENMKLLDRAAEPEEYYNFGHHIKTDYQEVFIEPRHYEKTPVGGFMAPCVRGVAKVAFENVQAAVYYGLTFMLSIILSVVWAIVFAINSFAVVWVVQPSIKLTFQWLRIASILYKATVRIALDPVYESCGMIFSRIAGNFTLNLRGFPENKL